MIQTRKKLHFDHPPSGSRERFCQSNPLSLEPFAVTVVIRHFFSNLPASFLRFIFVCIFAASSPALAVDSPELICTLPAEDGVHQSSDGVVDLKWSGQPGLSYQLEQQNDDGDFELRYEGPDQGSVRTGLAEGNHVFRVRSIDAEEQASEWADIRVQVEYMDAARVRLLLITGGIVVLATITAILFGHLNQRKEESA